MKFIKNNWANILLIIMLSLVLIPKTGTPIKVFVQRILAMSPAITKTEERNIVTEYQWPLQTLEGDWKDFSESKGRVVLLNFWATWCPPCIAELPSLQSLYDRFGEQVDFYLVTAEAPEKVRRFLQKKGYHLPVYVQTVRAPQGIDAEALPTTYLISKNGSVVIRETGAARWDSPEVLEILSSLLND
jgi:thiol-disulfide isomerase/thioredoxin